MMLDDILGWKFEWEEEEQQKARELSRGEIEKRLEIMENAYIDRFVEHIEGLKLLMFAWKKEEYLEMANECYSFLLSNYKERYKERFKQLEYMKEVNEIYEILKEFGELLEEYAKLPREKEKMREHYAENIEPRIDRMGKLSQIWGYRLNLYRDMIGKKPMNFEAKEFLK